MQNNSTKIIIYKRSQDSFLRVMNGREIELRVLPEQPNPGLILFELQYGTEKTLGKLIYSCLQANIAVVLDPTRWTNEKSIDLSKAVIDKSNL